MKLLLSVILLMVMSSGYCQTPAQLSVISSIQTKFHALSSGNKIYLDGGIQLTGTSVNIQQTGTKNSVEEGMSVGNQNHVSIQQQGISGKNISDYSVSGSFNVIDVQQSATSTSNSANHYSDITLSGNYNEIIVKQGATFSHTQQSIMSFSGDGNVGRLIQSGGEKTYFGNIVGNTNLIDVIQRDSGNNFLDIMVTGNNNTIDVLQRGNGNHRANISINNTIGSSNVGLIQQGPTNGIFSIQQSCANLSGCSISVIQGQ